MDRFFIVFAPLVVIVIVIVFALNLAMLYPINHESLLIILPSPFFHFNSNNIQPTLFFIDIYDLFNLDKNSFIQNLDYFVSSFVNYNDKALTISSNSVIDLNNKSKALTDLGNYTEALNYIDRALAIILTILMHLLTKV